MSLEDKFLKVIRRHYETFLFPLVLPPCAELSYRTLCLLDGLILLQMCLHPRFLRPTFTCVHAQGGQQF